MKIKNVIYNFLESMGYLKNSDIEGIIFYGSYQTNTNTENSDIDLIIVYNDNSNKEDVKGYRNFSGYKFEYFERKLKNLYNRVNRDYDNFEDTLLSVIGYGEILVDKNKEIEKLKSFVLDKYRYGLPKLNENDKLYYGKALQKSIENLDFMNKNNNPYFKIYYALTLDKIRDYYNKLYGFSNMSTSKVYKLYTDEKMKVVQHKIMPEDKFIKLYIDCIKDIKYENIVTLYEYSIKNFSNKIDFYNIRLKLGNKQH